jgi:hypothetical protein
VSVATEKSTTPRKSANRTGSSSAQDGGEAAPKKRSAAPRASAPKRPTALKVAQSAAAQLLELAGRQAEGVTGIQRTDDGWKVLVEVVEVRRIPDTTDILALYEVTVDEDGDLEGYRRLRRYARGVPGED